MLARSRSCCHRATTSTVVRRFFRGTASLYIFSILFSRKSRVPLDAAFSYLFLFIPRLLFCAAGITSSARIHPQLAFLCCRDDFFCSDASPACFFVPQGLFLPPGFISILLFSPQGLFLPPGFIPSLLFCAAGMISSAQMHLYLALFHHRDYCDRPDSSLSCSFSPQGLFPPPGFIPSLLFFSAGITSSARIHPYLALFLHRDYCDRSDSSLSCSFLPQGLLRPPGFIPILLLFSAGIISDCDDPP